jgi:hypothetical protein
MVALLPPKVTAVAPDRWVPVMATVLPGGPDEGMKLFITGGVEPVSTRVW